MRTCNASTCTNRRTMASKQKRQKFDPLAQKQSHRLQKTTGEKIKEACHQFWKALSEATFNCKPIPFAELSSTETELVLVSILGLRGVSALKCAMQIVPSQLCKEDRLQYISNIVTVAAVPMSSVPNTQDVIESFIPHSDKVAYFHQGGEAICDLRNTSYTFGSAHTSFLVPPVSCCINKQCRCYAKPLYRHHPPTAVTVFTLSGPNPGTKINLKCRGCSTIYNYSMYGQKSVNGEQFYEGSPRQYIEVTDEVYCERSLFELYCLLRYVQE